MSRAGIGVPPEVGLLGSRPRCQRVMDGMSSNSDRCRVGGQRRLPDSVRTAHAERADQTMSRTSSRDSGWWVSAKFTPAAETS
jgi:hypothetical protein